MFSFALEFRNHDQHSFAALSERRPDHQDLHTITILINRFLKTISFERIETQEIVTNIYVRLLSITDSISSRDAKNPATTFDL
jgi:hypothetical protein